MRYAIEALLIASAALAGYLYSQQTTNCEAKVINQLQHNMVLSNKLAQITGSQDFLTTLSQGRK